MNYDPKKSYGGKSKTDSCAERILKRRYKKTLIVGGGAMAIEHHLPRFISLLGSDTISVFEIDTVRRSLLKKRFKKNRKINIMDALPATTQQDLILIATPPKFHYSYYNELEDRTNCFFIEKPITMNATEALAMQESSSIKNKTIFVNLIRRTLASFGLIKSFYRQEYFGRLKRVTVNEGGVFNWGAISLGSFSKDLNGGGVLMDTGPHTLDLLFQVFEDLKLKSAYMDNQEGGIEANCTLYLTGSESIPISVNLSRNRYLSNTAVFEFEKATLTANVRDNVIKVLNDDGLKYKIQNDMTAELNTPVTFNEIVDNFYRQFLITGSNHGIGPAESVKISKLIDAAYASANLLGGGF
jgi:predicted dehydrogenase